MRVIVIVYFNARY